MDQAYNAFGKLLSGAADARHWPWFMVCVVLAVVGQIMSTRIFTRTRAYDQELGFIARSFWWWGRETLPFHPFGVAIFVLCPLWPDPEKRGWVPVETAAYWLFCAAVSLFAWIVVKSIAKKKGLELTLPGESLRP